MRKSRDYIGLQLGGWVVVAEIPKTWSHNNRKFTITKDGCTKSVWLSKLGTISNPKPLKSNEPRIKSKTKDDFEKKSLGRYPSGLINNTNRIDEDFYSWFQQTNIEKDKQNQEEVLSIAKTLKQKIHTNEKLSDEEKWLWGKIYFRISKNGSIRPQNIESILDEILDSHNSSSLALYQKSPRKQGVENLQRDYVFNKHTIELLHGVEHELTPNGDYSIRLTKEGDLKYGGKKDSRKHLKSFDSKLINPPAFVVQKVTTDDGGATDSVREEIIATLNASKLYLDKNPHSGYKFIFLLDGPYWEREGDYGLSRRENLIEMTKDYNQIFICTSDNINQIYQS